MTTSGLDYFIIIAYMGIMVLSGVIGSMKAKNNDDYLVAGRSLPFAVYFPCLVTVIIGGGATFGATTLGYTYGISAAWMVVMYGLGIVAMGFLLSSKMSKLNVMSLSEMLEVRYSQHSRLLSAIVSAFYTAMIAVLQIIALGAVLQSLLGWSLETSMLVGGGITLLYTMLGGMSSLAITDTIQFFLMSIGVFFVLLPKGLNQVGGFAGLTQKLDPSYFNPVGVGWEKIFSWFLLFTLGLMIGQDIWQRVFTAKTDKIAKTGTIAAGLYSVVWSIAMAVTGLIAVVVVPDLANAQEALPRVILAVLPTGFQGLVLAGIISAIMSTASGTILASSTLIINDLILPYKKNADNKKQELLLTRLVTITVGIAVLFVAFKVQNVIVALDIAYAILSGCVFVPVLAGFFWKRANWQGALASMITSAIVISITIAIQGASSTKPIIYGLITSALVLVVVSLLTQAQSDEKLQVWQDKIDGTCEDEKVA